MIRDVIRQMKKRRRTARALAEIATRPIGPERAHGLPSELIVSLTSYPARFGTLEPTLKALLRQSVQPDRVILWLAHDDDSALPDAIRALPGLEIRTCPDWRSYKKIIPTLMAHPSAYIITADDDVYYPPDWIERLVAAVHDGAHVACLRGHRIEMTAPKQPASYESWVKNLAAPETGPLVFPTGVSGVIYSPATFHPDVTRDDLFMKLAPSSDDVWLYWMHRMTGTQSRKINGRVKIIEWAGSQDVSLKSDNRGEAWQAGNDRAIRALLEHYGWPEQENTPAQLAGVLGRV